MFVKQSVRHPSLAEIALIGTDPRPRHVLPDQHNRIDQPSAKMRLSGRPGDDEWGDFRCGSRLGLSFIQDALSVSGSSTPKRWS
jgi:hypothetical protein